MKKNSIIEVAVIATPHFDLGRRRSLFSDLKVQSDFVDLTALTAFLTAIGTTSCMGRGPF